MQSNDRGTRYGAPRATRVAPRGDARGLTLVELAATLGILALALASIALALQGDATELGARPSASFQERAVRDLFVEVAFELDGAAGAAAVTELGAALSIVESEGLRLADASLFPRAGVLLVSPGRPMEERLRYDELDPATGALRIVVRGLGGTEPAAHERGADVAWSAAPGAATGAPLGHRADGSGFSYRPASARGRADGQKGPGGACLYFEPVAVITEAARGFDYNRDGDLDDAFDVGRLRRQLWAPDAVNDASGDRPLSPPIVLQERDARGADLDADGREDPLFDWMPATRELRLTIFAIVGATSERDVVERFEAVFRLTGRATD